MGGLHTRGSPRGIARCMATAAHKVAEAEYANTANRSKLWFTEKTVLGEQEAVPPEEVQEFLWKQFFANTAQWWDNRSSKPSPRHPDFRHKEWKVPLWLNNRHKPVWVDSQLATLDAGPQTTSNNGCSSAQLLGPCESTEGDPVVGKCRKLCDDGVISDAVHALGQLVQRGLAVPNNLFYRVLKRCIEDKDLASGRRFHVLIAESGYDGDPFFATQLMLLYASHSMLEEAMEVFRKVSPPNLYNWATIIQIYAKHGKAAGAICLYRQMCQSCNLKPDDRLFTAVLKACAAAKDLVAGKEVHAHILATTEKPDRFVQGGLVNMYAKCGCLKEARRLFDDLSEKNVVTWTAMIAGYAQQGMGQEALSLYSSMQQEGLTPNSVTYTCLLQACASIGVGALHKGRHLHAQIEQRGLDEDALLGGSLVNMYAKCGSLDDARKLFNKLPDRNLVAWTAMIAGYAQQGLGQEALNVYTSMRQTGLHPDSVTYVCLLQACSAIGVSALHEGTQLHAQIRERGMDGDVVLGGSLVNMYAKCSTLEDARCLFDKLSVRNLLACNAMLSAYVQQGMGQEALKVYGDMQREGLTPNSATYASLLQACATVGLSALNLGKQLHVQIEEQGLDKDALLGSSLVNMYAKCGSLEDARRLLDSLPERSNVAWTSMIAGYAQQGMGEEALRLSSSMQQEGHTLNAITYVCLLQACASAGASALCDGKQLHAQIEERGLEEDAVLGSSLVNMYAKCGSLEDARRLFDKLFHKTVVAWTAMIAGYAQQGMGLEALRLYSNMQQEGITPNSVTYTCLLQACASVGVGALYEGKRLHRQIEELGLEEDVVLGSGLVHMYANCGSLEDARRLFDKLSDRGIVAWTAMIAGYSKQGMGQEALCLYSCMRQVGLTPNSVTYLCLLQACANVGAAAFQTGKELHAQIREQGLEDDAVLGRSLVNMYAKFGCLEDARRLFGQLSDRNVLTWTAMIAGYAQQGMGQEALSLYRGMRQEGVVPNSVTYVCLLQASAAVAALPVGEQLHAEIKERGMQVDGNLGVALVNMYAKCGSLSDSHQVFDSLSERSLEAWNALLNGYSRQGDYQVVFDLLLRMRLESIQPDAITFLSVLTVCSHVGLVDEGRKYFKAMETDYGIDATTDHYICIVDLLGRAGHLCEALEMVHNMPFPPNGVVWLTLLGACRKWKNVEVAQHAFNGAVSVDEKDAAAYVLMCSIYASTYMWEAAKEMKARRLKLGAWKMPGQSWWTDLSGVVHTFVVGDRKHLESDGIYLRLEHLITKLKKAGYVPHLESSMSDVPDENKEVELCGHSEKLAIAYALNKTAEGTTIRIVKNLRVCEDCHAATAYISKVEQRTIICRDASRFHVYKEGECSCGGYW